MNNIIPLSHRGEEPENGVLYLVGTPIGNLSDISERFINILQKVFLIACEDTRETQKILNKFNIKNKLTSFNKVNCHDKAPKLINYLLDGKTIALVSDAGMPTICDPGEELVKKAKEKKIDVICIPGPCAALTALVSSGFPSSGFVFEGFLPRKKADREKILLEISKNEKTTVMYESPHRLIKTLGELKKFCGGSRESIVHRELTKKYEEHIGSNLDEILRHFNEFKVIGEFTIVLKGIKAKDNLKINELEIKKDLDELIKAGLSLSSAAKYLAKKNKIQKNVIYKLY